MKKHVIVLAAWAAVLLMCTAAAAAVPQTLTYSGRLSSQGVPVDETVSVTFSLYDAETDGEQVWQERFATLDVENGRFTVELGATAPIAQVLDGRAFWLGIELNGEALEPRMHVGSMPYAFRAGVADRVGDYTAEDLLEASSSADQIAYDNTDSALEAADVKAAIDALTGRLGALESKLADAEATIATLEQKVVDNGEATALNASDIASLQGGVQDNADASVQNASDLATLQADVSANAGGIGALETKTAGLSVSASGDDVYFTGVNLHVRSGSGATDGAVNGLGNLIVGYDEARASGSDKGGSHNLVVGPEHNYTSYAGVVFGQYNTISDTYANVTGGNFNLASGPFAAVSGGHNNEATIYGASVCGGRDNDAHSAYATISGGRDNDVWADYGSVSGGFDNIAASAYSWVGGGESNQADANYSSVTGGQENVAGGQHSVVSGGNARAVSGAHDWRAGASFEDL